MGRAKQIVPPDADEEARIARGIAEDPDTWVPSDEEWARAKPLSEVDPELYQWLTSGKTSRAKSTRIAATDAAKKQRRK